MLVSLPNSLSILESIVIFFSYLHVDVSVTFGHGDHLLNAAAAVVVTVSLGGGGHVGSSVDSSC